MMLMSESWRGGFWVRKCKLRSGTSPAITLQTGPKARQYLWNAGFAPNPPGSPDHRRIDFLRIAAKPYPTGNLRLFGAHY